MEVEGGAGDEMSSGRGKGRVLEPEMTGTEDPVQDAEQRRKRGTVRGRGKGSENDFPWFAYISLFLLYHSQR